MYVIFGMQGREAPKVCIKNQGNDFVVLLFNATNIVENPFVSDSIWKQAARRVREFQCGDFSLLRIWAICKRADLDNNTLLKI